MDSRVKTIEDLCNVALGSFNAGRYDDANKILDLVNDLEPQTAVKKCIDYALTAIEKEDYDTAELFLLKSQQFSPNNVAKILLESIKHKTTGSRDYCVRAEELERNTDDSNGNANENVANTDGATNNSGADTDKANINSTSANSADTNDANPSTSGASAKCGVAADANTNDTSTSEASANSANTDNTNPNGASTSGASAKPGVADNTNPNDTSTSEASANSANTDNTNPNGASTSGASAKCGVAVDANTNDTSTSEASANSANTDNTHPNGASTSGASAKRGVADASNTNDTSTSGASANSANTDNTHPNGPSTSGASAKCGVADASNTNDTSTSGASANSANTDNTNPNGASTSGARAKRGVADASNTNDTSTSGASSKRGVTANTNTNGASTSGAKTKCANTNNKTAVIGTVKKVGIATNVASGSRTVGKEATASKKNTTTNSASKSRVNTQGDASSSGSYNTRPDKEAFKHTLLAESSLAVRDLYQAELHIDDAKSSCAPDNKGLRRRIEKVEKDLKYIKAIGNKEQDKGDEQAVYTYIKLAESAMAASDLKRAQRHLDDGKRICPRFDIESLERIERIQKYLDYQESVRSGRVVDEDDENSDCCAICLGSPTNKCFVNPCLHKFCYDCIVEWIKVKAECPVCKRRIESIIYNVRENNKYDELEVEQHNGNHSRESNQRPGRSIRLPEVPVFPELEFLEPLPLVPLLPLEIPASMRPARRAYQRPVPQAALSAAPSRPGPSRVQHRNTTAQHSGGLDDINELHRILNTFHN